MKFSVLQSVDIFLFGGTNRTDATKKVKGVDDSNAVTSTDTWYSIEATDSIIMVVLPHKDKYDAKFETEYYTDGEEYEIYWQIYNEYFTGEDGMQNLIFAGVCAVLMALLIFFVLGGTIKNAIVACCCSKK